MEQPQSSTVPTVELGGRTIKLRVPDSFTVCNEIALAGTVNLHRAAAAALGVCWREKPATRKERREQERKGAAAPGEKTPLRRPAITYEGCGCSPFDFGGRFTDALVKAGVPWAHVYAAGMKAYNLLAERAADLDADVEDELGNSSPPQAAGE